MLIRKFFLVAFSLLGFSYLLIAQDNIIIEDQIQYRNQDLTAGIRIDFPISFENAIWENQNPSDAFYLIQKDITGSIDSANIYIANASYKALGEMPQNKITRKKAKFKYKIVQSSGKQYLNIQVYPFASNGLKLQGLTNFKLFISLYKSNTSNLKIGLNWKNNSVLAQGDWYKVKISKSGIYKITGLQLEAMGFSISSLDINKIRLYGNGGGMYPERNDMAFFDDLEENAIEIIDENQNGLMDPTDYFLFYGKGPNYWKYDSNLDRFGHSQNLYTSYAYYFITIKSGQGKRIQSLQAPTSPANKTITDFVDFQYYDNDSLNLIKSGKLWLGDKYDIIDQYNYTFNFPNLNVSEPIKVKFSVVGRSTSTSTMDVSINGQNKTISIPFIYGTYNSAFASSAKEEYILNSNSPNILIHTQYNKSTTVSVAWMDYIEVQAHRSLVMSGSQMKFRNPSTIGAGNISKFILTNTNSNTRIWDITEPTNTQEIVINKGTNTLDFTVATDSLREFIAFDNGFLSVTNVGSLPNQDLHATAAVDFVICYYNGFKSQAEELAEIHRNRDQMKVITVEQSLLFNEFSSGAPDISALRNFMKMLYDRALQNNYTPPKYLLLFGDASYDYKDRIANNTNKLLCFQSATSTSPTTSYSSDDYFGLLDNGEGQDCYGTLDIGIGRFPVNTTAEANLMIDKVKRYIATHDSIEAQALNNSNTISNLADWRNMLCFVGDDEDVNIHVSQADYLADYVKNNYPAYNIDKIYLDSYVQKTTPGGERYPDATRDLNLRFNQGSLIINYTGHGGEIGLAHESLIDVNDIQSWNNKYNLALFITATCEFSRYEDPARISAGEYSLLNQNGGVIGLLTTSRLTYSSSNFTLNKVIYSNILKKTNNQHYRLGDIIRLSKVGAGSISNNRNFVLLGDPALQLAYPKYDVVTTHINGQPIQSFQDTIGSLSKVSIGGQVEQNGTLLSNFNGYLYPTIYDKAQNYTTLANDPASSPYTFSLQKNIIYKGKATIKNGKFTFEFIVPKDINYTIDYGRISYYAENGMEDANGYFDSLMIGGNSNNIIVDILGPQIVPFMNDTNFVNGGITDENPIFYAKIMDDNGINTTGNGIGHDIVLTLDGNTSESIPLNAYYKSNIDSYKEGSVFYPLQNLSEGQHHIDIKVWDILNNSSTASLDFIVAKSEQMLIQNIMNYPNPFSDYTNFVFEHNLSGQNLNVEIQIYNQNGSLVRVLDTEIFEAGYKIADSKLRWKGRSMNGGLLKTGIYTYRIIVKSELGENAVGNGKMIFMP